MRQLMAVLGHELGVLAVVRVSCLELVERMDQGLGDKSAAVRPEMPLSIGLLVVEH